MRYYFTLIVLVILMIGFNQPVQSQTISSIAPITSSEIAEVKSNLVVTGIVAVEKGELRIKSSAIINDWIVWMGKAVTVKDDGRTVVGRNKKEWDTLVPYLKLIKVERSKVYLEYSRDGLTPHKFIVALKKNELY